ncbi:MAG: triphosphoribosyl-dephospho-CoA synthase [Planctomycetota bacterium]|nr:triphosphoribosyl-dephospho-CoA synthase [Planctomycetota bacterium]
MAKSPVDNELTHAVRLACVLEATARKPGNVHPDASFDDLTYDDFIRSADAIAPVFADAARNGVGETVLEAVRRTHAVVGRNTNLGIVLLIAPLAAVPRERSLIDGAQDVLDRLTIEDTRDVYAAIRLAQPGGMGEAAAEDIDTEPSVTLQAAMRLAADRDAIAAEYTHGFPLTLGFGLAQLRATPEFENNWRTSIVRLHLSLMARQPDTLIARKRGMDEAIQSSSMARDVLDAGWPNSRRARDLIEDLDVWLRAVGNQRNPGTTADLVAASVFAAIREGVFTTPDVRIR